MGTGERGKIAAVNHGWAGMAWHSKLGGARAAAVNRDEQAIHRKRGGGGSYTQLCLKIGIHLVEMPG